MPCRALLRERFIPRLVGGRPDALLDEQRADRPGQVLGRHDAQREARRARRALGRGRGARHGALGLRAKAEGKPLWRLLADRYRDGEADPQAWVYAAGGYYYPGKGIEALQDEMRHYHDLGYAAVKIKIGGAPLAEDLRRIEAVLKVVGGTATTSRSTPTAAFVSTRRSPTPTRSRPIDLRWYEEPLDPLDYAAHAILAERYAPPLATGENLFSVHDARNLIRHGGLRPDRDVLQFDPALSYGLVEYLRTLDMLERHGWSPRRCVPHGGHQFALNIAVGLGLGGNESYPDVFAPFGGFADDCPVENSLVRLPDIPGIGFEAKSRSLPGHAPARRGVDFPPARAALQPEG